MSFSVNTNIGAMTALQSLNATQQSLATTQNRINTGLSVASTKDDSASYTIAQKLRGDVSSLKAVTSSLGRAKSTTDVAVAGAEQVSDLLNQMRAKALEASDKGQDAGSVEAIGKDFTALREQIKTIIDSSEFNGTNLLKSSGGQVSALQSTDTAAETMDVANVGLDAKLFKGTNDLSITFGKTDEAKTMVGKVDAQIKDMKTTLSTLGAAARKVGAQLTFVSKLSDVIQGGIGNLVDADLAKESANLQAFQVKQQLGVQALSIANQAPQTITSLFR